MLAQPSVDVNIAATPIPSDSKDIRGNHIINHRMGHLPHWSRPRRFPRPRRVKESPSAAASLTKIRSAISLGSDFQVTIRIHLQSIPAPSHDPNNDNSIVPQFASTDDCPWEYSPFECRGPSQPTAVAFRFAGGTTVPWGCAVLFATNATARIDPTILDTAVASRSCTWRDTPPPI